MAGMLKAAGALLAAGVAVFAVFFCLGHTQAQTAPEQAAVQQSEGLVQADGGDDVSDGYSLLFPDLNAEAITAISIDTPESSFRFYTDGNGGVSVNGRQADAEIYGTLVDQISGLPVDVSAAFSAGSTKLLLTLTVYTGSERHTARFYEDGGTGEFARVIAGTKGEPEYGQTCGWRVGTLMMTCEGTRIQDERGNEQPTDISPSAAGQP